MTTTTERPKVLGKETPRVWTRPLRKLTPETSAGFDVIAFAHDILGLTLHAWQQWLLIHMLELLPDGSFRFRTVIILVARQNGKSLVLAVLSLWWMYVFGAPLVIGTAQNLDVAEEQWEVAVELAESDAELKAEIAKVSYTNGKKYLRLHGYERPDGRRIRPRYKVAAASRKGGRGLSGDLVLLDELREHLTWDAWAAVTKTQMARVMALKIGASNAGDAASIVLRHWRKKAHLALGDPDGLADEEDTVELPEDIEAVASDYLAIFEWSAAPGTPVTSREGWAQANPSLNHPNGVTEAAIIDALDDPEFIFRMEVLCQWLDHTVEGPFPAGAWEAGIDDESKVADGSPVTACVEVSWDRSLAHIAVAGWRADGSPHVELVASDVGVDWIIPWLTDPGETHRHNWRVAVRGKKTQKGKAPAKPIAPVSSLIDDLVEAGVDVVEWNGVDGVAEFYDRIRAGDPALAADDELPDPAPGLYHRAQPALDTAAANSTTKPSGDTWTWDLRRSPVDAAPLVAATGALWCLMLKPAPTRRPRLTWA